jgi:hypothetical protein
LPFIVLPSSTLEEHGFPPQPDYIFVRLLGVSYLALCIGYVFGLRASLRGERLASAIWVGIVSNGGACLCLAYFGFGGAWLGYRDVVQFALWFSFVATGLITAGLFAFGVFGKSPALQAMQNKLPTIGSPR